MEGVEETVAKLATRLKELDPSVEWQRLPLFKMLQGLAQAGFDVDIVVSPLPRPDRPGRLSLRD